RLARRRGEALVAATRGSSASDDHSGAGMREICEQPAGVVEDLRPDGNVQLGVLPRRAVLQRAAAAAAAFRLEALIRPEGRQIAQVRRRDEHHVAAGAAVAPVRATFRNVLLAPE